MKILTALFLTLLLPLAISGQSMVHEKLLYEHDLMTEADDNFAQIIDKGGEFTKEGWRGTRGDSKLIVKFKDRLPQVGSVEFSIFGFVPTVHVYLEEHVLAMLSSSWDNPIELNGDEAWLSIRSGRQYVHPDESMAFELDAAPSGHDTRQQAFTPQEKVWDKSHTYFFRLAFDHENLVVFIDGEEYATFRFDSQVQRFKYLFLGGDYLHTSIAGIRFSNLRVYTAEPEHAIFFQDKTYSNGIVGLTDPDYRGNGVAVADVNGDGLEDLFISNCTPDGCDRDILYIQHTDTTFLDETAQRGIPTDSGSYSAVFFDADNDGDADLFTAGAGNRNRLYFNDGSGFFREQSASRGISTSSFDTRGVVAFDVNRDGWLDLFAVNSGQRNEMYINDGSGSFRLETRGAEGSEENSQLITTEGVTVSDIDNDGDFDIYISKGNAVNELYINNGGQFSEVAQERGVDVDGLSKAATFADYDNDGDMDLFVANENENPALLYVFENDGLGYFADRSTDFNLPMDGGSIQFADIDNDGYLDLYRLNNENPGGVLELSDGAGGFQAASYDGSDVIGAGPRANVLADMDQDGDQDIYIAYSDFENAYLENLGWLGNRYLKVRLIGPQGDAGGVGGKIDIYEQGHLGDVNYLLGHREVTTMAGFMSSNSLVQHFGLGRNSRCDVRVTFANGVSLDRNSVAANQELILQAPKVYNTINYVSGDQQSGFVDQQLPLPFRIRVTNQFGNGVPGIQIDFVVAQGNGVFSPTASVTTDASGYAQCYYQPLQAGEHVIEARAAGVQNSPIRFAVTAEEAMIELLKISGDNQTGTVGMSLPQQIVLNTAYEDGSAAAHVEVSFQPSAGGLVNGAPSAIINSDAQGLVAINWTLGTTAGEQVLVVSAAGQSVTLNATARAGAPSLMQKISGDGQQLQPGVAFPQPFKVKLQDQYSNPISDYPVVFQVVAGTGTINGSGQVSVATDASGMAGVQWTPDPYLGPENRLQATASQNGAPINGSPVVWTYAGIPVSAANSNLTATGPVPADGTSTSEIIVTLRDENNQNVGSGLSVEINVSGSGNQISPAVAQTNANGEVRALLSSRVGETKTITARVLGLNLLLEQRATVEFESTHAEPVHLLKISADQQAAVRKVLPLVVQVTDEAGRPVPEQEVLFVRLSGDGSFDGANVSTLRTDEEGKASAYYRLGMTAWLNHTIEARASGIEDVVRFQIRSVPGEPQKLLIVSGNNQRGAPGTLATPLVINVKDLYDNNVMAAPVRFQVNIGGCRVNGSAEATALSDSSGLAFVSATFADSPGQSIIEASVNHVSVSFTLTTTENAPEPDLALCTLTATTPVPADGYSTSHITATIYDAFARPIPGVKVSIEALGSGVQLAQPDSLSDPQGRVFAELASTEPGEKSVVAYILPERKMLQQVTTVVFEKIVVDMAIHSGDGQSGVVGMPCADSLVVRLHYNGLPVVGQFVKFSVLSGDGHFGGTTELVARSDFRGLAAADYVLGTQTGKNIVLAQSLADPEKSVEFHLYGQPDTATRLSKLSGDDQRGIVETALDSPLVVQCVDKYGNSVPGASVVFSAIDGGFVLTPQPALADSMGRSLARFKLGSRTGRYTFKAELPTGEFQIFTATAERANSAPEIISFVPFETTLKFGYGNRFHFELMNVFDADGDSLSYTWRVNGRKVGSQSAFDLLLSESFPPLNIVTCTLSDGLDSTSAQWTLALDPTTSVDITAFQGQPGEGGIMLTWTIDSKMLACGFRVLRSRAASGPFEALLRQPISSDSTSDKTFRFLDDTANQPGVYYYKLEALTASGATQLSEAIAVTLNAPEKLALRPNYPNPFNPSTLITFELPDPAAVVLTIYNSKGQTIRRLIDGHFAAGIHTQIWDARDDQGRRVTSGLYFCVLSTSEQRIVRKLTLLK